MRRATRDSSTCGGAKIKRKCCTKAPRLCTHTRLTNVPPITVELHEFKSDCAIIDFRLRIWRIRLGETGESCCEWKLIASAHVNKEAAIFQRKLERARSAGLNMSIFNFDLPEARLAFPRVSLYFSPFVKLYMFICYSYYYIAKKE